VTVAVVAFAISFVILVLSSIAAGSMKPPPRMDRAGRMVPTILSYTAGGLLLLLVLAVLLVVWPFPPVVLAVLADLLPLPLVLGVLAVLLPVGLYLDRPRRDAGRPRPHERSS